MGFTNCVFEKLCLSENTIFLVFSAKHSSCNKNSCMLKKTENFMKNSGLFLSMAKRCFLFAFFPGFNVTCGLFLYLATLQECLKMLVFFSQVWGLCGVAYSSVFGFGRFRCFCVSCV